MSTFEEKLAAKKAAKRPTADVQVLLAEDLSNERKRLKEIIEAPNPDPRLTGSSPADDAQKELDELEASAGDSIITLRFTQLRGSDWSALTSQHPPRPYVPIDEDCGYNFDAVAAHAARFVDKSGRHYAVRIENGEEFPLKYVAAKPSENIAGVNEWEDLFEALTGHEVTSIRNTIWGLNEYMPKIQLAAMGKAFGAKARSGNV